MIYNENTGRWEEEEMNPEVLDRMWRDAPSWEDDMYTPDLLDMWRRGEAPVNLLGRETVKMDIAFDED